MSDFIHLNGQLLPADAATISPHDAGLLHGAGLFETMRAKNKKIFRLTHHLARLTASAQTLQIPFSLSEDHLAEMATDLLEANSLGGGNGGEDGGDARLRLTLTRGDLSASTPEDSVPPVTLLLTAQPFTPYPAEAYAKGLTVIISPFKQNPENPLTGHKSTSYFDRLLALRQAHQLQAAEALWFTASTHYLAEGSISNIFLVDKDNLLSTPPLTLPQNSSLITHDSSPIPHPSSLPTQPSSPITHPSAFSIHNSAFIIPHSLCLPGITRQLILDLATQSNILPHERLLTIHDLLSAKEVFLTNAIMGVMPVTRIEKHEVATALPGPLTQHLHSAYQTLLSSDSP